MSTENVTPDLRQSILSLTSTNLENPSTQQRLHFFSTPSSDWPLSMFKEEITEDDAIVWNYQKRPY